MALSITKGKIGNALTSTASDHVVAVAADIYDEALSKYQSEINQRVSALDTLAGGNIVNSITAGGNTVTGAVSAVASGYITVSANASNHQFTIGTTTGLQNVLDSKAPLASPTLTGTPKAPTAAATTNTTQIATTAFVQNAIATKLAATDAMIFAGTVSGTGVIQKHNSTLITTGITDGTTNISALTNYSAGWTFKVTSAGTIANIGKVETGDMLICTSDYASAYKASDWSVVQNNVDVFAGTNGSANGTKGLVPAPQAAEAGMFLASDGTWLDPTMLHIAPGGGDTSFLEINSNGDYTSLATGEGLNVTGSTTDKQIKLNLNATASNHLGGIRLGYPTSGKNYPVEVNSSAQAYVSVPWTDTKVTQNAAITTAGEYPIIIGSAAATTATTSTVNKVAGVTINPSNKTVTATTFAGNLRGDVTGNVTGNLTGTASKATADASGNNIVNTYATKTQVDTLSNLLTWE